MLLWGGILFLGVLWHVACTGTLKGLFGGEENDYEDEDLFF